MTDDAIRLQLRESAAARPRWRLRTRPRPAAACGQAEPVLAVEVVDSIHAVDAATWDALVGNGAVMRSHAYLAAVEDAAIAGCRHFYLLVRDAGGSLVAHACVHQLETDFAQLMPAPVRALVRRLRRRWPRLLAARVTECASPLVAGCSVTLAARRELGPVMAAIETAMSALAARTGSTLLVLRDFENAALPALDFLVARGYKRVCNLPLARIVVRWASHAEYLAAMRGRYRKDLKRRLRRAARDGRVVETCTDFAADAARWARQAAFVVAGTRGFRRESVNAAYYANLAGLAGATSELLTVVRNGETLAHGMVLADAAKTVATFFGREPGPPDGEWFQLMNAVVAGAIARGSRHIDLGLGSYEAKALFGAELVPLWVYTRSTRPWLNALIRLVPDLMRRDLRPRHRVFHAAPPAAD
ncbi:MAG: GNAT family N-acetyltransferase [Gammaproteobacteria bacterium]